MKAYSASLESKLVHSYEHLTEVLADVDDDIFRPWVEDATITGCWVVHGCASSDVLD